MYPGESGLLPAGFERRQRYADEVCARVGVQSGVIADGLDPGDRIAPDERGHAAHLHRDDLVRTGATLGTSRRLGGFGRAFPTVEAGADPLDRLGETLFA